MLEFERVSKKFPGVVALDGVSFSAASGSIHALMGENGAGKSTLLKILSGAYRADSGTVRIGGQEQSYRSTADAIKAGVAVIYQELHLVQSLSVAENILLGHLPSTTGVFRRKAANSEAKRLLNWLGEDIDPQSIAGKLPIAQRQMVEIAKALSLEASVIAFDEPTSSLSSREVARLFSVIRQLRDSGKVVLYVSHRMSEIYDLCDAVTVLRDGKHVATWQNLADLPREVLVKSMVGREILTSPWETAAKEGETALEVRTFLAKGLPEPADFNVLRGEIVGIFGLVGSGRTELLKAIGGLARNSGRVSVAGASVGAGVAGRLRAGLAYCPEDRKGEGIFPLASVQENLSLGNRRGFALKRKRERELAAKAIKRFGIKCHSPLQPIGTLSGGNQQKAILARVLARELHVLLLDEPTRGIDVGAKQEIYDIVRQLASSGAGILFVSSELPEVLALSDRIFVMREGALKASFSRAEATEAKLLQAALPQAVNA